MKFVLKLIVSVALLQFLTVMPASAQIAGGVGGGNTDNQASSGTLISAVMEQVGYHAQNQVLQNLNSQIESVASLIYLGVLVSILITVGLLGNYRAALWILVGPPMFFYASGLEIRGQQNTIQGASVEWRFGEFRDVDVSNSKEFTLQDTEVGNSEATEVSYLFHKYNELISELYQYLIGEITNNRTRTQLIFTARTRMMEELFNVEEQVPGFVALGHFFSFSCSTEMYYASYLAQSLRNPAILRDSSWEVARDEYCRRIDYPIAFPPGPWQDYMYSEEIYDGLFVDAAENASARRKQENGLTTCNDLWRGMMHGARNAVGSKMEKMLNEQLAQSFEVSGNAVFQTTIDDILEKLTEEEEEVSENQANRERIDCGNGQTVNPLDFDNNSQLLTQVVAAYVVKKTITRNPYTDMMSKVTDFDHGYSNQKSLQGKIDPDQMANSFRRQQAHQNAKNRQYEAMAYINFFPYLQGAILYGLSVLYPFFCVMLLLPSHAGNFITWLALWAWAKSWDVGWAIVMVADEVLWELMPKTAYLEREGAITNDAVTMLEMAFDGDHSYNTGTYWLFVSTLTSSVPVISANIILGTKKAVAGAMIKSFSGIVEPIAGGAGASISAAQGRESTTRRENSRRLGVAMPSLAAQANANANKKSQDKTHQGKLNDSNANKKAGSILKNNGG